MSDFDNEMNRGLNGLVKTTNYRDWVNPVDPTDDDLREQFRAAPVSRQETKEKVNESVDGLPVKDRDIVEGEVARRFIGDDRSDENSSVEESGEVVRGNLKRSTSSNESGVPEGNIRQVTNWVGDDKDKAQKALDAENQKDNPRKSLVEKLEEVIGE